MMKRILFIAIMIFSVALTISAQQAVNGDYAGKFTRIYMNGEKSVPTESIIAVVSQTKSLITLKIAPFKIGKMPGTVEVTAENIVLNSDGTFNQVVANGIKMEIKGFMKAEYNAMVTGTLINNVLTYTITSRDASFMGKPFSAIVGFKGMKE